MIYCRQIFCLLLVVTALAALLNHPVVAQTGVSAAINTAPDPRVAEAQRRLMLSRHRRLEGIQESLQLNQLLTEGVQPPEMDTRNRLRHRKVTMHRATTPQGRRAVRAHTSPEVNR